ncbi:MarR family winged helix-turn-helix transcriptional regulator [Deinococcus sp. Marseille-Q6407]|uniref:MarR family winged helix-turn-helix transcriptional regulator n=1 Tax=Deinococcus sp. Marseille-Q6407 TaxID=2969223 RepID=UPI0021C146EF|nr:transcriptional regulator [Deinococcus sp. Marseille-Q6407]
MSLYEELLQNREYDDLSEEAVVSLPRTHAVVMADFDSFVRQYGVTPDQYNILRILRGAWRAGEELSRAEIRRRLIDRVSPDLTHLLTRLEKTGLVSRESRGQPEGKHPQAPFRITAQGLDLLARMDEPLRQHNMHSVETLDAAEQRQLISLLGRVRQGVQDLPSIRAGQAAEAGAGGEDGAPG